MTHEEMIELIRRGIAPESMLWADMGAGSGAFTRALAHLLPQAATIYAVDKDATALAALRRTTADPVYYPNGVRVVPLRGDLGGKLALPPLDGILIANALHWLPNQQRVLENLRALLRPGGVLLAVEYDVNMPRPYIPYPLGRARFARLVRMAGYTGVDIVGERRSPSTGIVMVALLARA
ncbi:MAG: class I SAM-dependent methyltransferase [Chloroflexota bacterium]